MFLSIFPFLAKVISIFTFFTLGRVIDKTVTTQGKARPWILVTAPLLTLGMILVFAVPQGDEVLKTVWILISYKLLFSIILPMYSTSHTLLVPLATKDIGERNTLSMFASAQMMIAGTVTAVIFPSHILPAIGVDVHRWLVVMSMFALVAFPLVLMQYLFTKERVTQGNEVRIKKDTEPLSAGKQLKACLKSNKWVVLMVYMLVLHLSNAFAGAGIFYYSNWVLGSYNDSRTQALFYGLGNAPIILGLVICTPLFKKFGKRRAMIGGFLLAFVGICICLIDPYNLGLVLFGQIVKSFGLIPASFVVTALLAESIDDVEEKTGHRCDGISSSVFNIITTVSSGLAIGVFNFGLAKLGYIAPKLGSVVDAQNTGVQRFFVFSAIGCMAIAYLIQAGLMYLYKDKRQENL